MARSIQEIKKTMTDKFMADPVIRQKYSLSGDAGFDSTFSAVSLENIMFFIVASAIYVLETFFEQFKIDVDAKVATAVLASIPWYHKICLEFQNGDSLVFDETTMRFKYPVIDPTKQIVKYAACRDRGGGVLILVSGADSQGLPVALPADVLMSFKRYLSAVKPAGVIVDVFSYDPDEIAIDVTVQYDPMVLQADGTLISEPTVSPVIDAVNEYVKNIVYGGVFNKTRLVDAIQAAPGVVDLVLQNVAARPAGVASFANVQGNNYTARGGAFQSFNLADSIKYVLSI